jgi:hypothetical protein
MTCKCGNPIRNAPEHLADSAEFCCRACTHPTPRDAPVYRKLGKSNKRGEAIHIVPTDMADTVQRFKYKGSDWAA